MESLAQVKCLLSERMSVRLRYNRTVNTSGKAHSNYPKDLDVEHNNKILKSEIHAFRGRITDRTLDRISKSSFITDRAIHNIDKQNNVRLPKGKHTKIDTSEDIRILVEQFQKEELFQYIPRRCHSAFSGFKSNPLGKINNDKLNLWLYQSIREISETHYQ